MDESMGIPGQTSCVIIAPDSDAQIVSEYTSILQKPYLSNHKIHVTMRA